MIFWHVAVIKYISLWPSASYAGRQPFCFTAVVYFFFDAYLRGCLANHHQTLPHVRRWPRFIKFGQKFRWPIRPKFGRSKTSKLRHDFAQLNDLIANISGMQQEIVNPKMALQTTDIPAQTNLMQCTTVHKWRSIGPEFWSTVHPTGGHHAGHCHTSSILWIICTLGLLTLLHWFCPRSSINRIFSCFTQSAYLVSLCHQSVHKGHPLGLPPLMIPNTNVLTLYRMVMPIGTPFLKEKNNN